jgi:hypothetical protein
MSLFVSLTTEKTSTVGNHVYLADYDDQKRIRHVGSHLACFYAGNWLLGIPFVIASNSGLKPIDPGGKLANNDAIVNIGLQLNDACWNTYAGDAYVFFVTSYGQPRTELISGPVLAPRHSHIFRQMGSPLETALPPRIS